MTEDEVIALLAQATEAHESAKAWALAHGVSPQYVNDVLKRRRAPGERILRALGLERVVTYRRIADDR